MLLSYGILNRSQAGEVRVQVEGSREWWGLW